jgi:hypothetical protein
MNFESNKFNAKYKDFFPTKDEYLQIRHLLRPASVHQTLGPNWKDIYWTPNPVKLNKRPCSLRPGFNIKDIKIALK